MVWPIRYHAPSVVLGLCLTLGGAGCTSDNNDNAVDQATLQEVETALSSTVNNVTAAVNDVEARQAAAVVRQQVTTNQEPINVPPVACLDSGELRVAGQVTVDDTSLALAATLSFINCDGLNGAVAANVEGIRVVEADGVALEYDATLNGAVTNDCSLTFDQVVVSASRSAVAGDTTGTIDGAISATCGPVSLMCSLEALVFPQGPDTVTAILANSCQRN